MAQALKKSPLEQVASTPVAGLQPNILIVDDRKENLLATEKVLRHLDAGIFKANSGNEALSLMLRHKFAAVLLDVQMPEMDGFEVAMLMQQQESMRGTPIIFITAISKEEKYATQAAEIGAVDYIFKPINADILRSKVKVYLDLYNQRQQILKLFDGLMQSNEELERFAYVCSHDMQEPVRMMNSYSELLLERCMGVLDDKGERYLHYITENAQRMQKMIADILTFSRVGREEIMIETVDSSEILQEVLTEFETIISASKAKVTYADLPVMKASQTLLRILLQNLIGNALKFQNSAQPPEVHITATQLDDFWQFRVRDNGIGIDPNFYDRVFTIFQRIHRREEYPGTGIGLSTCQKFIRLCGGDIRFDSVVGQGTTFYFTLPVAGK